MRNAVYLSVLSLILFLLMTETSRAENDKTRAYGKAELQVHNFPAPPAPDYVLEFADVDAISISKLSLTSFDHDFPHTQEELCQKTYNLIQAQTAGKKIQIYGCGQPVPKSAEDKTMYLEISINKANSSLYKGRLKRKVVFVSITMHRLEPYRSIYPMFGKTNILPCNTEEEWTLLKDNFSEFYAYEIERIAKQLKREK